jgi:hypothetical protein
MVLKLVVEVVEVCKLPSMALRAGQEVKHDSQNYCIRHKLTNEENLTNTIAIQEHVCSLDIRC